MFALVALTTSTTEYDLLSIEMILVDNAQLLRNFPNIINCLQSTKATILMTFSPIITKIFGDEIEICKIKVGRKWYFGPFSSTELDEFKSTCSPEELTLFDDAKQDLLPGLLTKCIEQIGSLRR